jgi:hypothetical protein
VQWHVHCTGRRTQQLLGVNNVRSTTRSRGHTTFTYCQPYCQKLSSGAHASQDSSRQGRCRLIFCDLLAHAMRLRALLAFAASAANLCFLLLPQTSQQTQVKEPVLKCKHPRNQPQHNTCIPMSSCRWPRCIDTVPTDTQTALPNTRDNTHRGCTTWI